MLDFRLKDRVRASGSIFGVLNYFFSLRVLFQITRVRSGPDKRIALWFPILQKQQEKTNFKIDTNVVNWNIIRKDYFIFGTNCK